MLHIIATFEEKQFESAVTAELSRGSLKNRVFSSGQFLEHIVGYDAASDISRRHKVWQVLSIPRPRGVHLVPEHWPAANRPASSALPSRIVSLILQYKRPEYITTANGKQWELWHKPYFRIRRQAEQHKILLQLERRLGLAAAVRYAAPAFHEFADLELAQVTGQVLTQTGFVRPSDVGSHTVWTYVQPGIKGRGNPSGSLRAFDGVELLISSLESARGQQGVVSANELLSAHGAAVRYRSPILRQRVDLWLRAVLSTGVQLSPNQVDALRGYASMQSACVQAGAHWWLTSRPTSEQDD